MCLTTPPPCLPSTSLTWRWQVIKTAVKFGKRRCAELLVFVTQEEQAEEDHASMQFAAVLDSYNCVF